MTCSIEQFKRGKDSVSASARVSVSRNAANAGIAGTPRRPHVRTEKYKMKRPESPGSEKTLGSAFKSARLRSRRLPAFSAFPYSPLRGRESQDSMFRLNSASPFDQIQALYRLLLIRTGHRSEAEKALRQIFSGSPQSANRQTANADFAEFFRAALKLPATGSDSLETELDGWPLALHQLPEPERSAITLFYLEIFSPAALGNILGVGIQELARIIETARNSLEVQRPNSDIQK